MAKILVIEDDPNTNRLLNLILGRAGHEVCIASDGLQGLNKIRTQSPDLILLDLTLPDLDGFQVLSQLRTYPQTAEKPIVVVSAKSRAADRQAASQLGADGYLIKPHSPEELLTLIHSLLPKKAAQELGCGTGVVLLGPHSVETTTVALYTGLALAEKGETTLMIDLRPLSVEHPKRLGVTPLSRPISLSEPEALQRLPELTVQHPNGLRLLNNLEGGGVVGQLLPQDVQQVLDGALVQEGFVLIDLPIYPNDLLKQAGSRCSLILLVAPSDPTVLTTARHMFAMMERNGLAAKQAGIVLTGMDGDDPPAGLPRPLLTRIPQGADPSDAAFHALADRLVALARG